MVRMDSSPLVLPTAPAPARRPPLPFIAAVVPVAAGVVLWLVSGSLYALCFAALGPLMIFASLADGARNRRRERRVNAADLDAGWARAEEERRRRQQDVRAGLWHRYPDAVSCVVQPPLRDARPPDSATEVVIGRGVAPSGIRVSGGEGDRVREFERSCATVLDAPVRVPLGRGLCVRGAQPVAAAVARALVAQLCLRFGAGQLALVGEGWDACAVGPLPHRARARRGAFRLGIGWAHGDRSDADAVIWLLPVGADVPDGVGTVIDVSEPGRSIVRTTDQTRDIAVEGLSRLQLEAVAQARMPAGSDAEELPALVLLSDLTPSVSARGLPATIGRGERGEAVVDIVGDGPHAIVTGMTGTGKSELLVSWVTAIAQSHGPDRVSFVLADFKGGTAFEPLRSLRQVAAVITDLDESGARRGVSSLTAELRRREALLARAGARDVSDVPIPRLVIVVDEFAALLQEHPDLGAVFTDVAARGRALGMHLILGTQRASGVIRDALAANCPLRIGLRVVDAADSRLVIGSPAAAEIPGGVESRGLGFIRRPQDAEPSLVRVARTEASDLRDVAMRWTDAEAPHSPWLPALPVLLPAADLLPSAGERGEREEAVLGRADDPAQQRQPDETLRIGVDRGMAIIGAPGSGRTTALRLLAAQRGDTQWVGKDLEAAWDLVAAWATGARTPTGLVLCDDLDHLVASFPPDHAQRFVQNWEYVVRTSSRSTFVMTASRAAGPVARLMDMLPRRALLRLPSRVEHLAAGGEASGFVRDRPPGRARIGEREVQIAWLDESQAARPAGDATPVWAPGAGLVGILTGNAVDAVSRLRAAYPRVEVIRVGEELTGEKTTTLVVGEAEGWQRHPSVWQRVRDEGALMVRAENPADLRVLAGVRELPPYAVPHAGRAWIVHGDGTLQRVVIPALDPRIDPSRDAGAATERSLPSASSADHPRSRRELRGAVS